MKALIAVSDGIEEMETVITADILVRAGIEVVIASVQERQVKASRGVSILADTLIKDVSHEDFDIIICPGGLPGAQTLQESVVLKECLLKQHINKKWLVSICASPAYVFAHHGILDDHKATCYPGNESWLNHYLNQSVVTDGHIITSQGPGTAILFSLEIVRQLMGEDVAHEVAVQGLFV